MPGIDDGGHPVLDARVDEILRPAHVDGHDLLPLQLLPVWLNDQGPGRAR
jgi:hypothetical protein